MAKKYTLEDQQIQDLQNLTSEQKIEKLAYIEKEIASQEQWKKDQAAAANDLIGELKAQRKALLSKKEEE